MASARGWRRRHVPARGTLRPEFHCTSLPDLAFTDLLDRILFPAGTVALPVQAPLADAPPATSAPAEAPDNTVPAWTLPLLRCLRTEGPCTLDDAIQALPSELPPGVACPSVAEAETFLRRLGYFA